MPSSKAFCIVSMLGGFFLRHARPPPAGAGLGQRQVDLLGRAERDPDVGLGFADAVLRGRDRPRARLQADLDVLALLVGRDLEAAGAAILGLEDHRRALDDLVGRVDDLALDHAGRLGRAPGRFRPPGRLPARPTARAGSASTSPTASRLPPHCRFRALRAHRAAYTRCFAGGRPRRRPAAGPPTRAVRWRRAGFVYTLRTDISGTLKPCFAQHASPPPSPPAAILPTTTAAVAAGRRSCRPPATPSPGARDSAHHPAGRGRPGGAARRPAAARARRRRRRSRPRTATTR